MTGIMPGEKIGTITGVQSSIVGGGLRREYNLNADGVSSLGQDHDLHQQPSFGAEPVLAQP